MSLNLNSSSSFKLSMWLLSNRTSDEIQVTVIYSHTNLVAVTSECSYLLNLGWGIGKMQTQIRCCRVLRLIMVCTVCLNIRKLRVQDHLSWSTLRDNRPTSALIYLLTRHIKNVNQYANLRCLRYPSQFHLHIPHSTSRIHFKTPLQVL